MYSETVLSKMYEGLNLNHNNHLKLAEKKFHKPNKKIVIVLSTLSIAGSILNYIDFIAIAIYEFFSKLLKKKSKCLIENTRKTFPLQKKCLHNQFFIVKYTIFLEKSMCTETFVIPTKNSFPSIFHNIKIKIASTLKRTIRRFILF